MKSFYTSSFNKQHQNTWKNISPLACHTAWNSTTSGSQLQTPQGTLSTFSHQHWSVTLFNQLRGLEGKKSDSDYSRGKVNLPIWVTALEKTGVPVWAGTPRRAQGRLGPWERRGNPSEKKVALEREGQQLRTHTSFSCISHKSQQKCFMNDSIIDCNILVQRLW